MNHCGPIHPVCEPRLGFSIVSHMEPNILLLDEVMSVGDHDFRKRSRARIEEMVKGEATVVIVSHSVNLLRELLGSDILP